MSHYAKFQSQVTDREALIRALCVIGRPHRTLGRNLIEVHDKAQNLYGYRNDRRPETANVIIRRANVGNASNDLGFSLQADGTYQPIISEFDQSQGYNKAWLTNVYTQYNVEKTKMELDARNIPYTEGRDESGRAQITARFRTDSERNQSQRGR